MLYSFTSNSLHIQFISQRERERERERERRREREEGRERVKEGKQSDRGVTERRNGRAKREVEMVKES